ncbi:VOC family protein [Streptomyces avermitilis]|uniref:VOC family protein n=1 Tax=Streptomyces avermitilis TaxID=33903 RepID=UPI0033FFBFF6
MAETPPSTASDRNGAAFPEGVPCWVDAQLPDVEAGKRFYGELFGWTFGPAAGSESGPEHGPEHGPAQGSSVWAYLDGDPVAALAPKGDGRMPTVWTVYFSTPDAAALAGRIRTAGGQVINPPTPLAPLGTFALAADPEDAVFGLWQAGTHPGFGRRHEPGSFGWTELYARDTAAADSFYADLFHDALFGPGARPDFGRASVTDVFPAEMPPHFLVHFGVREGDDAFEDAIRAVNRLGGRVQVPSFDASYGRVAVVTDNQGASFALLQR